MTHPGPEEVTTGDSKLVRFRTTHGAITTPAARIPKVGNSTAGRRHHRSPGGSAALPARRPTTHARGTTSIPTSTSASARARTARPTATPRATAPSGRGERMRSAPASSTRAMATEYDDSLSTWESLIHRVGATATTAAAARPAPRAAPSPRQQPAMRRAARPAMTTAAAPSRVPTSRWLVGLDAPTSDAAPSSDGWSGGWAAVVMRSPTGCR